MPSNVNKQSIYPSLLKKLAIERRISTDDLHPLSLIIIDLSPLGTMVSGIDNKQKKTTSIINEILADNTRKKDLKTFIHKSKFALFLPNTPESGAHILSDRIFEKIKKVLNKNNTRLQKSSHILFQISTYPKTSQGEVGSKIFNEQYKKSIS